MKTQRKIEAEERKYKQYILDDFQVLAIRSLENNHSVVVSAATGTGKTLIADYVVDRFLPEGKKIVYTAPIKALSNQKFKDFKAEYGEQVGMLTGDVVINPDAPFLIMTTEIYRNMLITNDPAIEDISHVIFDEIHFINDIERGTIWEESIIFSPNHVRFLCLSATIPNAKEFADWISTIKKHTVDIVKYDKRAVPLEHFLYDAEVGMITPKEYKKLQDIERYNSYDSFKGRNSKGKRRRRKNEFRVAKHFELVRELEAKRLLPCIFFVFSRKACEEKAKDLRKDFSSPEEKAEIISVFRKHVNSEYYKMETVQLLRQVLPRGIGVHHAGLLPGLKSAVEELFNKGLIKVLYATETFAVGINMPAKSVAFSSLEKYDGINFRYLNSKEYFQMAGRAGRRGLDKKGIAVALIDKNYNDFGKIVKLTSGDSEPIISQFKVSFNTVLNLLNNFDNDETIETILKSSFDYYLRKKQNKNIRVMSSFNNHVKKLRRLGFVDDSGYLTDKGEFARFIYSKELLITEIFEGETFEELSEEQILIILGAIIYEPRKNDSFAKINMKKEYNALVKIIEKNQYISQNIDKLTLKKIMPLITEWANGVEFVKVMELTNLGEGDVIRLIRQIVDFLRQIIRATKKEERIVVLSNCINRIYRDVIKAEF